MYEENWYSGYLEIGHEEHWGPVYLKSKGKLVKEHLYEAKMFSHNLSRLTRGEGMLQLYNLQPKFKAIVTEIFVDIARRQTEILMTLYEPYYRAPTQT